MKSKKIVTLLIITLFLLQVISLMLGSAVYAVENKEDFYNNKFGFNEKILHNVYIKNLKTTRAVAPTFTTSLTTSNNEQLYKGDEFEVNVKISDLIDIDRGIIVVYGKLDYDEDIELMELVPQKKWQIMYNENNKTFVMDNEEFINNENIDENDFILKMKFKAKETITEDVDTTIRITDIKGSNGKKDIPSQDAILNINIKLEEEPIFTSEKYNIEENHITRIAPGTTFKKFKSNVETNQELVLKDRSGNLLDSDDYCLATNMTLTVGERKTYTIVVIGDIADIDGNGMVTITDLAQLKLHYIGLELLPEVSVKAADINGDNQITITDLAQLKLVIIGLMEIE